MIEVPELYLPQDGPLAEEWRDASEKLGGWPTYAHGVEFYDLLDRVGAVGGQAIEAAEKAHSVDVGIGSVGTTLWVFHGPFVQCVARYLARNNKTTTALIASVELKECGMIRVDHWSDHPYEPQVSITNHL